MSGSFAPEAALCWQFQDRQSKNNDKKFQVRKTQKRNEPGIGAVEVAVIVVDPTVGHVLLIGLPLETAPRRAALTISSHSLKRLISTRELCAKPPGAPPPGGPPPGGPPPDGPPAPPGAPPLQGSPNQDNNIFLEPVPPPIIGALWPKQESREGPSLGIARDPSGFERWLKNAPPIGTVSLSKTKRGAIIFILLNESAAKKGCWPVTASPIVPRPVSVTEGSFPTKGSTCNGACSSFILVDLLVDHSGSFSPPLLVDPMPMTNLPPAGQTANQRSGCLGSEQVRLVLRGGQGSEQEGRINSWK